MTRDDLRRRLVRAAMARAAITMVAGCAVLVALTLTLPASAFQYGWAMLVWVAAWFGIEWLVTVTLCKRMVACAACGGSLWSCGTGNFKPRRMRLRENVTACPHCGVPFV